MKKLLLAGVACITLLSTGAWAREAPLPVPLTVKVGGIKPNGFIPAKYAYCTADGKGATKNGGNVSPKISWSGKVDEAKSYVVLVVDKDVPASFELANQKDKVIPVDFSRQDFYHWVLVDIPVKRTSLAEGRSSTKVIEGGKPLGKTAYGVNGQNDYAKMNKGPNGGYDGPCPPWNDERMHHYHFSVYALDVESLELKKNFSGRDVEKAMAAHIVGKGEVVGRFTTNPKVKK